MEIVSNKRQGDVEPTPTRQRQSMQNDEDDEDAGMLAEEYREVRNLLACFQS